MDYKTYYFYQVVEKDQNMLKYVKMIQIHQIQK